LYKQQRNTSRDGDNSLAVNIITEETTMANTFEIKRFSAEIKAVNRDVHCKGEKE